MLYKGLVIIITASSLIAKLWAKDSELKTQKFWVNAEILPFVEPLVGTLESSDFVGENKWDQDWIWQVVRRLCLNLPATEMGCLLQAWLRLASCRREWSRRRGSRRIVDISQYWRSNQQAVGGQHTRLWGRSLTPRMCRGTPPCRLALTMTSALAAPHFRWVDLVDWCGVGWSRKDSYWVFRQRVISLACAPFQILKTGSWRCTNRQGVLWRTDRGTEGQVCAKHLSMSFFFYLCKKCDWTWTRSSTLLIRLRDRAGALKNIAPPCECQVMSACKCFTLAHV